MADLKINLGAAASTTSATTQPVAAAPAVAPKPAAVPAPLAAAASSFKDLFSKAAVKSTGPKMIESIVSDKTTVGAKLKPILGSAPQLQKTLEQQKQYRQKRTLRTSQVAFAICFLLSLGATLYFYSELSPTFNLFGPNTTAKLIEANANLSSLQTKVNTYKFLAAQLDLNNFSYAAEQFLDKTAKLADPSSSASYKSQLAFEIQDLQDSLPVILASLRKNIAGDITIKTFRTEGSPEMDENSIKAQFETDLRAALQAERDKIAAGIGEGSVDQQELKLYDNAIKLVGNDALVGTAKRLNLDDLKKDLTDYRTSQDPLLRSKLQATFSSILSTTNSDMATISAIKASRMNWASLIKQIETITASVDPQFGKGLYNELGGIIYSNYEFDQQTGKIVISGESKRSDAKNFTLLSDLINKFEESPYFKDVEMRSFSKSGDAETGYTASFSLNLGLDDAGATSVSKTISLGRDMLKTRTGFRRIKR